MKNDNTYTNYCLFLDDVRNPKDVIKTAAVLYNWVIVRSYNEFIKCIKENGMPFICSFDHDLDNTAYQEFHNAYFENRNINYDNIKEKTGLDCAKWLVDYCKNENLPIPLCWVHSLNIIGSENINKVINDAKQHSNQSTS